MSFLLFSMKIARPFLRLNPTKGNGDLTVCVPSVVATTGRSTLDSMDSSIIIGLYDPSFSLSIFCPLFRAQFCHVDKTGFNVDFFFLLFLPHTKHKMMCARVPVTPSRFESFYGLVGAASRRKRLRPDVSCTNTGRKKETI